VLISILKLFSEIIIVAIPILLSLPEKWVYFKWLIIFRKDYAIELFILLIITIVLKYIFENKIKNYKKHIKKLENTIEAYQNFITSSIEEALKDIFNKLQFGEEDRITFFLYSSSTNKFYFSGRYSSAPKYRMKGRTIIDNEQEYVYKVLNEEKDTHHKYAPKIKNGFLKNRTMESNSMYGVSIWDDKHSIKIGVLICQSMRNNAYRNKTIRQNIQKEAHKLQKLINNMKINPSILPTDTKPLKGF